MKEVFYDWGGLNVWLFKLINGVSSPMWGSFMATITDFGEHKNMRYYVPAIAVVVFGRLFYKRMRGWTLEKREWRTEIALIVTLVMGYAAYGLLIGVFKTLFVTPRPFMVFYTPGSMRFWLSAYPEAVDYYTSFPSGHAATIAFLVTVLWPRLPHYGQYFGLFIVALICVSRVAVGMHFPADVVGGVLLGAVIASLVRRYVYRMLKVEYRVARPPK